MKLVCCHGPLELPDFTVASIRGNFPADGNPVLHCCVGLSILVLNRLMVDPEDTMVAIHHHSLTLRMVNERLSVGDGVSDTTIAAVLMMAQFEHYQDQHQRGLYHLQALRRIADLRGGIAELKRCIPYLTQKIFR